MSNDAITPLRYDAAGLHLIDQRLLPGETVWLRFETAEEVAGAITDMVVRGAPAIGCAAAYGMALAARRLVATGATGAVLEDGLDAADARLRRTRPTAVNLFWALDQMRETARAARASGDPAHVAEALEGRAIELQEQDVAMCRRIGAHGAPLMPDRGRVLTHCNAGALATGGYGTALGVFRGARDAGKTLTIVADETRPYLQGARLTAWEMLEDGFDVEVIPDGAAAHLMARGEIAAAVVGADRIAANGDTANKIGTYGVALAAHAHGVPFYVAAPLSTIDFATPTGADIPIEERSADEMYAAMREQTAPASARPRYPGFDVTPARLITAIVTDRGLARPPYAQSLAQIAESDS